MSRRTVRSVKEKSVTTIVRCDNCGNETAPEYANQQWTTVPHEVWGEQIWMDYCDECSGESGSGEGAGGGD